VRLQCNGTQEDARITWMVNAGIFQAGQEKSTTLYWADAEGDYMGVHFDTSSESDWGYGITTDGTYIWIIDSTDDEVYKYTTAGVYQSSFDTSAQSGNGDGIATDGTYIWIIDSTDDEVHKYTTAGVYQSSFDTSAQSGDGHGITTDGTYIWVIDYVDDEVYKYTTAGVYQSSFDTSAQSGNGHGIATDGTYIWIIDYLDDEVHKYTTAGVYQSSFDTLAQSGDGHGITTDGTYIWIIDYADDEVYKYEGIDVDPIPQNIALDSDASFSRNIEGWCNATVKIETGLVNLKTVDIRINQTLGTNFTLRWTQSTDTFSETSDGDGICTLNTTRSTRVNLNFTTDQICFCFAITSGADGPCDVTLTSTNDDDTSDVDDYIDEFTYQTIGWNPIGDTIDSAFNKFGLLNYMTHATAFVTSIGAHFTNSLVNLATLINLQFQVIWQVWNWATGWFTRMITTILNFGNQLQMILNGTHPLLTGAVDLWNYFNFASAGQAVFDVAPLFFLVYWIDSMGKRARTQGSLQVLYGDLNAFTNIFAYFMGAFSTVIGLIEGKISWLLNALT